MLSATVAVTMPPIMNTSPWAKLIQLEDAVDERVAERDEGVERTVRGRPDQEDPEELIPVLHEIDAEPEDDERDERQADRRDDDG